MFTSQLLAQCQCKKEINLYRGVPLFISALILGSVYTYSWIIASVAALGGLALQISFNHNYVFPICIYLHSYNLDELIFFDIFYVTQFVLMGSLFYYMEYKGRYDFLCSTQEMSTHGSFKRLLKHFPNGVILLDNENMPLFYNRTVGVLISKKTGKLSTRSPDFEDVNQLQSYKEVNLLM